MVAWLIRLVGSTMEVVESMTGFLRYVYFVPSYSGPEKSWSDNKG